MTNSTSGIARVIPLVPVAGAGSIHGGASPDTVALCVDGHRLRVGVRGYRPKSILTRTSGFIADAGFTHSLTPARNCTYGCSYCYVPTLHLSGGLQPEDWTHWGEHTTFKMNAPDLLRRSLRASQIIYCSPLVDPYQPAEAAVQMMPRILDVLLERPPRVFTIQTRAPLIVRDLERLVRLARETTLRISVSLTTNRDDVRRRYEPHCASIADRVRAMMELRAAGVEVYATLAPILPCDPEALAHLALEASDRDIIADPLHSRGNRRHGAVTREAACRISARTDEREWHEAVFQAEILHRVRTVVESTGRHFDVGVPAFARLATTED
jgi:DNA repair photolyase